MAYAIEAGLQISLDGINWYAITDHNRKEIKANPEVIEKANRMANGKMRKYVIAKKVKISTSWEFIPSQTEQTVDLHYSSEWLTAFYNANVFAPVYVKIVNAKAETPEAGYYPNEVRQSSKFGSDVYETFITAFSTTTVKRTSGVDFVNMDIEFTEI
jgi:hypothetical protein